MQSLLKRNERSNLGRALAWALLAACAPSDPQQTEAAESPYVLVFAADDDMKESDFLAVFDVAAASPDRGKVVATTPIGLTESMPHHMEYVLPPRGEPLFVNAHHRERALLIDVAQPLALKVIKDFAPPPPFRFMHDFSRTPTGTRLVGFLRSEGESIDTTETAKPGNSGGIAEYSVNGDLMRTAMAGNAQGKPVRPYAFALLKDIDRLVVTSAMMMEEVSADVVQVYRYSDFTLLKTIDLPPGRGSSGEVLAGSQSAGFGPRILPDGSVFFNSYGCAFYRLSDVASAEPRLQTLFALDTPTPEKARAIRGSCGIPVVFGHHWINPSGDLHAVVVLDVADPSRPREVSRLTTPDTFNPHWLARDPLSNRLVLGAELGGEEGFYILRFDDKTGTLTFDASLNGEGRPGYISLANQAWPHGATGKAWGHAALFMPK